MNTDTVNDILCLVAFGYLDEDSARKLLAKIEARHEELVRLGQLVYIS